MNAETRPASGISRPVVGLQYPCPLVVLGASAGGLEAFQQFFEQFPPGSGLAFLLVQHIEAAHEKSLRSVLSSYTRMPVGIVVEGTSLDPDNIYVLPPHVTIEIDGCSINKVSTLPAGSKPLDQLLKNISKTRLDGFVVCILSGTGADGSVGIVQAKAQGAIILAQQPKTARSDGMPLSAIQTGCVDFILTIPGMVKWLQDQYRTHGNERGNTGMAAQEKILPVLPRICTLLQKQTGHDFSRYKESTVVRRVQRRMQLIRIFSPEKYIAELEREPAELECLFKDLLIGVTQFFRDPESFAALENFVIPKLFEGKSARESVRVWVAGCATGEEAYSFAILLAEHAAKLNDRPKIQVFGTDLDADALDVARKARYPAEIAQQLPPERLNRFFRKVGDELEVTNEVRELCIFSPHNLIKDPPFSHVDVLSCRNLLIYLESDVQKNLLRLFHYSLSPAGFLFLGPAENIASRSELFHQIEQRHRIYQRTPAQLQSPPILPKLDMGQVTRLPTYGASTLTIQKEQNLVRSLERMIIEDYAPASVIVNRHGDVLYFSGQTGKFLEPAAGVPSTKLISMARKSLRLELRIALHRAITSRKETVRSNLRWKCAPGETLKIDIIVRPLPELGPEPELFMVVFRELVAARGKATLPLEETMADDPIVKQLENELRCTKEDLQTTIEELETSNEELKSANEELLSMNEELQSANEELQTSKEEIQSSNEELKRKVEQAEAAALELRRAFEDRARMSAIVQNSDDAIISKTLEGIVTSWNAAAERIFGFSAQEMIGQSIMKIIPPDRSDEVAFILGRLRKGERVDHYETERRTRDGRIIYVSITSSPIRDQSGVIIGAAKVARDITDRRQAEEIRARLASVVESSEDAIITKTLDGTITSWNRAAERLYGYSSQEIIGKSVTMLMPSDRVDEEPAIIERLRKGERIEHYETVRKRKDGTFLDISLTVSPIKDSDGKITGASKIARDITGRKQVEEARFRLAAVVASSDDAIVSKTLDGYITSWNHGAERIFGYTAEEIVGRHVTTLFPPDRINEEERVISRIRLGERVDHFETVRKRKDGSLIDISLTVSPIKDPLGKVIGASKIARDITEQNQIKRGFREAAARLEFALTAANLGAWTWDTTSDVATLSERAAEMFGIAPQTKITWAALRELLHPEDQGLAQAAVENSLLRGTQYSIEYRIKTPAGQERWISSQGRGNYREDGTGSGMAGVVQDITKRKRIEQTLHHQNRTLQLLQETGAAIAAELELQNLLQKVTDSATRLTGAQFGAFFYNVIGPQGEAFALYTLSGAPREAFEKFGLPRATDLFGHTFRGEGVVRCDDVMADPRYGKMAPHYGMPKGHLPVRSYLAVPVRSRSGEVIGGLFFGHSQTGIFTELSENLVSGIAVQAAVAIDNARLYETAQREVVERQRVADELEKAREELSQHAHRLEQEVAIRTASLKEALSQLEEFSYSVSHDLRAPLRGIRGYTRVIMADFMPALPEEAHQYLTKIEKNADRMERLVNDVLTMSRVARADIKLHAISLQEFITDIIEQHSSMHPDLADISVTAPHVVIADDASLSQAITNLLTNAVKFVPQDRKPQVVVRSAKIGDQVRLCIEDNGIGVPENYRKNLFSMFQRLPETLKYEGTGIGLAIVRKAVERMAGTLGMEPNQPVGSRFWIKLKGEV